MAAAPSVFAPDHRKFLPDPIIDRSNAEESCLNSG